MQWRVDIHQPGKDPVSRRLDRAEAHAAFRRATDDPTVQIARLYQPGGALWLTWAPVTKDAAPDAAPVPPRPDRHQLIRDFPAAQDDPEALAQWAAAALNVLTDK